MNSGAGRKSARFAGFARLVSGHLFLPLTRGTVRLLSFGSSSDAIFSSTAPALWLMLFRVLELERDTQFDLVSWLLKSEREGSRSPHPCRWRKLIAIGTRAVECGICRRILEATSCAHHSLFSMFGSYQLLPASFFKRVLRSSPRSCSRGYAAPAIRWAFTRFRSRKRSRCSELVSLDTTFPSRRRRK